MSGSGRGGWLLAVDTALRGAALAVAVAPDGSLLGPPPPARAPDAEGRVDGGERALVTELRRLFQLLPGPLLAVVAGRGPGSYSGLRLGVAAALGAAQARGCPLRTVPSLAVSAGRADPGPFPLLVVHPAGRGGHHRQAFRAEGQRWVPLGPAELVPRGQAPAPALSPAWRILVEGGAEPSPGDRAVPMARSRSAALARLAVQRWEAAAEAGPGYDRVDLDYGDRPGSPWS